MKEVRVFKEAICDNEHLVSRCWVQRTTRRGALWHPPCCRTYAWPDECSARGGRFCTKRSLQDVTFVETKRGLREGGRPDKCHYIFRQMSWDSATKRVMNGGCMSQEKLLAERIFRGCFSGAAGCFRGFCRRISSPHFCGKSAQKNPPGNPRQNPPKCLQQKSHMSAEGPGHYISPFVHHTSS